MNSKQSTSWFLLVVITITVLAPTCLVDTCNLFPLCTVGYLILDPGASLDIIFHLMCPVLIN